MEFSALNFDRLELEQLRALFDQQVAKLADELVLAVIPFSKADIFLPTHGSGRLRLRQALRVLFKWISSLEKGDLELRDFRQVIQKINGILWCIIEKEEEYVNTIAQSIIDFSLERLRESDINTLLAYKNLLKQNLEEIIWVYHRLEEIFINFRTICQNKTNVVTIFSRFFQRFASLLDDQIPNYLFKLEENLSITFQVLQLNYNSLKTLVKKIEEKESVFNKFRVYKSLSLENQSRLLKLYRMLKIDELNQANEIITESLVLSTIRKLDKIGQFEIAFREYQNVLEAMLFELSLEWKKTHDQSLIKKMDSFEKELNILIWMVGNYRKVWLRSDPALPARSKWGFSKWIARPEPRKTKDFLQLLVEIERLHRWLIDLKATITKGYNSKMIEQKQSMILEINLVLHEMGQPFLTRSSVSLQAELLVDRLESLDELGGKYGEVKNFMTETLLKALRYDKYQVLFDSSKFEEIYWIHDSFLDAEPSIFVLESLKKIKRLMHQMEIWLKQGELEKHEIELNSHCKIIEEELNCFFRHLKTEFTEDLKNHQRHLLLKFRYAFGKFFHSLRSFNSESTGIRTQLSFTEILFDDCEKKISGYEIHSHYLQQR